MSTVDNFSSPALATPASTSTFPVLRASNAGAGNHTLAQVAPFTGRYRHATIDGNLGTLSSLGTNTTMVNGTMYYADVFLPVVGQVLTGIGALNGTTAGTNNGLVALFDNAGVLLASSALAGALSSGANAFQERAFTATYTVVRPGRYFIGYQQNGTTATMRTVATATWINLLTGSAAGTFGTIAALTPPTTFTADVGPIAYVY